MLNNIDISDYEVRRKCVEGYPDIMELFRASWLDTLLGVVWRRTKFVVDSGAFIFLVVVR